MGLGLGGYSESLCETERQEESQGFDSAEVGGGGGGGGEKDLHCGMPGEQWYLLWIIAGSPHPPPPPRKLGKKRPNGPGQHLEWKCPLCVHLKPLQDLPSSAQYIQEETFHLGLAWWLGVESLLTGKSMEDFAF